MTKNVGFESKVLRFNPNLHSVQNGWFHTGGGLGGPPSILANYEPMTMKLFLHGYLDVIR